MAEVARIDGRRAGALLAGIVAGVAVLGLIGGGEDLVLVARAVRDLVLVGLVGVSAWGLGGVVGRGVLADAPGLEVGLTRLSTGLLGLAVALLLVGLGGFVSTATVAAVLGLGLAGAVVSLARAQSGDRRVAGSGPRRWGVEHVALGAVAVLIVAVCLRGALLPEVFFDALSYHDPIPELFLRHGRVAIFPHEVHSAMPLLVNVLYIPLVAFGGATTVKLGHLLLLLGCCLWVGALTGRFAGSAAALASGLAFAAVPGVGLMAGMGGVDLGVTYFCLGSVGLVAWHLYARPSRHGLALGGALLGAAVGAKYSALAFAVALVAGIALASGSRARSIRERAQDTLVTGGAGGAIAAFWYLRNWAVLGTPLYPSLSPFGSAGAWAEANLRTDSTPLYPVLGGLRLIGDVVLERVGFGAGAEVWPVVVLCLAALPVVVLRPGLPRFVAAVALGCGLVWSRSVLVLRYAYPALALFMVLVGPGMVELARHRVVRALGLSVLCLVLASGAARQLTLQQVVYGSAGDLLTGRTTVAAWLDERLPHHRAATWVRTHTASEGTRLLLLGETQGYYFGRDLELVGGYDRHPLVGWLERASGPSELAARLHAEGFTHLVMNAAELDRLNEKYRHCVLTGREREVLARYLSQGRCVYRDDHLAVFELAATAPPTAVGSPGS